MQRILSFLLALSVLPCATALATDAPAMKEAGQLHAKPSGKTLLKQELAENPAMDAETFEKKAYNVDPHKRGNTYLELLGYYESFQLARKSPLKNGQDVVVRGKYFGTVRYVYPKGVRAAIELEGNDHELYSYDRREIGKSVRQLDGYVTGQVVLRSNVLTAPTESTILFLYEGGHAGIQHHNDGRYIHLVPLAKISPAPDSDENRPVVRDPITGG